MFSVNNKTPGRRQWHLSGVSIVDFNQVNVSLEICGALRDLVPCVQFKKREKHPWRSFIFSSKSSTPPWMFFTFFKLYEWYQIAQSTTYLNYISEI